MTKIVLLGQTQNWIADKLEEFSGYVEVAFESSDDHAIYFDAKVDGHDVTVKVVFDEEGQIAADFEDWHIKEKLSGKEDWDIVQ